MRLQILRPIGPTPHAAATHRFVQTLGLQLQHLFQFFFRGVELRFRFFHQGRVFILTRVWHGFEGFARVIGQYPFQVFIQAACKLALTITQGQHTIVIQTCGGNGAVGQFIAAPTIALGDDRNQFIRLGLY